MGNELMGAGAPVVRRVRAYFAPVNRATGQPTVFDAAGMASFDPDDPIAPWVDLGSCLGFARTSGTKMLPIVTGSPGTVAVQARTAVDAEVSLRFESWGKLQMALTAGVQQMNVLRTQADAAANGSGGAAVAAVPLTGGSSATTLAVGATAAAKFNPGDVVAVDVDYTGQVGFVGSGVAGGYVRSAAAIGADVDYVRRITLNVARVTSNAGGVLAVGKPLLAGVPAAGMQVSPVVGFCDREGGSFFGEWSALFVEEGEQGDRAIFHYPRLQALAGPAETRDGLVGVQASASLERLRLAGRFRALPVRDANDGELIVCFRSYLPAAMRAI